jgi:hypothetical protein
MAVLESVEKRSRTVFFSSLAISIILAFLFLSGAFLTNASRGELAYSQVDMAAGSIFVFVITLIISLSLLPKVMDRLENRIKG